MDPATGAKDSLLPKLEELLEKEFKPHKTVREDLIFLHRELKSIQEWSREARDLSYDMEHVVLKFWARRFRPAHPPAGRNRCLAKVSFKRATPSAHSQFASDIKGFKDRLTKLANPRGAVAEELVGVDGPVDELVKMILADEEEEGNTSSRQPAGRNGCLAKISFKINGFKGHLTNLAKPRTNSVADRVNKTPAEEAGSTSNPKPKVVSIHGLPGVGKTTLANEVYRKLKPRFDCAAFVSMSSMPINKVLWDMLTQISGISLQDDAKFGTINREDTIIEITNALQNKRYFIVFDDVREIEAWKVIKERALIGKGKGSNAVLLTTSRSVDDIAATVDDIYSLEPLPEDSSRKLFYNRFSGSEEKYPGELLAEICTAVIGKCRGIPSDIISATSLLAATEGKCRGIPSDIISATSLLAATEERDSWQAVLVVPQGVVAVAASQHGQSLLDTVPPNLKPCLLYLSMFEKGCKISVDRLVWEWIAEGFIPNNNRKQGEEYLRDLIDRKFMEVDAGGNALSCRRVHEFMEEVTPPARIRVRRLSIQGNSRVPPEVLLHHVRSLFVSGDANSLWGDNLMPSLSKFENVRVLDLWGCQSLQNDHLSGIEGLVLLKHLVVRGDCITDIPKGIGSLVFLQTLDLRETRVKELPEGIVEATQLICLRVNRRTKMPHGIGKMEALEELGDINVSKPELLKELCSLTKLKVLGIAIWSWDESNNKALLEYLSFLFVEKRKIESLSILTCCSLDNSDKILHDKWDPPELRKIEIRHITFHKLPGWISSVQNLSSLSIELYKLSHDVVGMLGELQNLFILSLTSKHAPEGELFGRDTTGFSKLTSFHFASNAMGKIFGIGVRAPQKLERIKLSFHVLATKDVSPSFDFGFDNLSSLKHIHVEIICVNASPRVVEEAEAAIDNAIRSGAKVKKEKVREEEMVKNEEEVGQVCSQVAYFDLIQTFNLDQRQAIEEVGFGGLLKMKSVKIRHELCKSLADVYDIKSEAFHIGGSMLKISIEDVDHLMGLPSKGEQIVEAPKTKETGLFSLYKGKKGATVPFDTLLAYFSKNKGHDEDFIGTMLLYTIGVLICPTEHRHVSSDYLNLVEKVEEIKTVNWASLTLHHLKSSIKKYKIGKENLEGNSVQNLEGNLALLQLWYWEKLCVDNIDYSGRERPLLQYWDEEKASKREKYKIGEGKIVEDIRSPDKYKQSSESDNNIDEVRGLVTQLIIDNMHHQLQLLNHDSKVKETLRDIRLNDAKTRTLFQEARDHAEVLMKQVLDAGCGPSDKSGIVERFYNLTKSSGQHKRHLHSDGKNSTIGKTVLEPAGMESTSTFHNRNATLSTPQMEQHETTNVSEDIMCTEQDNQTIARINSSKVSDILVRIDDVCITKQTMEILTKEFVHDGSEKYLDDKLIDASIYCLRGRYLGGSRDGGKVFEDTKACQLLSRDGEHTRMSKGTIEKGENIKLAIKYLKHDMIFLPFNKEQHWYLAVVSAKHREIQVLDSMASSHSECEELKLALKGIERFLELAANRKETETNSWPDFKVTSWKVRMVEGLPKQEDGSSCGLFMLKYMEHWTGDRLSMSFTQNDIHQFRRKLAAMLVNNPLNQVNNNRET